ncbi:MAG: DNA translocase FtsK [Clostridiaceae bacterium]|nr:DNA translocase FtsK [Clostridiaceae bacterium]
MGKQKKKQKASQTSSSVKYGEIAPLIIVAMGLLMGVSFLTDAAGLFGIYLRKACLGLFGYPVYGVPFIIMFYGIHYSILKGKLKCVHKYWAAFGLVLLVSSLMHILSFEARQDLTFWQNIQYSFKLGQDGQGGGAVGAIIAEPVLYVFGTAGASILFITGILMLIIFITEVSVFKLASAAYPRVKKIVCFLFKKVSDVAKSININILNKKSKKSNKGNMAGNVQEDEPLVTDNEIKIYDHQQLNPAKGGTEENGQLDEELSPVDYAFPPIDLLTAGNSSANYDDLKAEVNENANILASTLKSFGVKAKVLNVSIGPSVTRYEVQPSVGVKVSRIVNLADDIALNLAAPGVRIEAPIPGKSAIGIEVPNKEISTVYLREVIESEEFMRHPSKLAFALGKDISGKPVVADIARMPHLLIAGATGSGKSVCINTLVTSILYKASPKEVKMVLIDPKVVELGVYNGIPHLLIPVVTDPRKAAGALNWAVQEMVNRYKLFADNNVRDIKGYNSLVQDEGEALPHIVIIIDELADLMMVAPNEVEDSICRLAQMARAAGMHLVIATQRPSVDVITGVIKANIPSRISFAVYSQVDSRTILDMAGAEKLLGKGDMLFYPVGAAKPIRVQGGFISDKEVEDIVNYIKQHSGASYNDDIIEHIEKENEIVEENPGDNDELLPQAIQLVVESGQASISMLQRRLKIGYARAARLMDQMEARGIVGGFEGSKPRQVLISRQQYNEMIMHKDE